MIEAEVDSSDIEDEEVNYKKFLEIQRGTREKKPTKLPREVEQERQEAVQLYISGHFNESFEKLKSIMRVYPKIPELYSIAAMMYEEKGEIDRAARFFEINAELSVPSAQRWCKIGDLYFGTLCYEQAAYCYGRALKSNPQNVRIMKMRAQSYRQCNYPKKAILMYNRILQLQKDPSIIKQCARLHCLSQQFGKARDVLQLIEKPDESVAYMICQTYLRQKNYQQIQWELHRTILSRLGDINNDNQAQFMSLPMEIVKMLAISSRKLDREESERYIQLLLSKATSDNMKQVDSVIKELEDTHPKSCSVLLEGIIENKIGQASHILKLAELEYRNKNVERAAAILEFGLTIYPSSSEITAQLGFLKIQTGQEKEGAEMIRGVGHEPTDESEEIFLSDQSADGDRPIRLNGENKKSVTRKQHKSAFTAVQPEAVELSVETRKSLQNIPNLLGIGTSPEILLSFSGEIQKMLEQIIKLDRKQRYTDDAEHQQKKGIFERNIKQRRRRFRALPVVEVDWKRLSELLADWLEQISALGCWGKISTLSTSISRLTLRRFPVAKQRIFKVCVLACLHLNRYRKALYFLRYLLCADSNNTCYLLLTNVLMRKLGTNSLYRSFFTKLHKRATADSNLYYLLAFQHIESGSFKHAIVQLSKLSKDHRNQEMIDLSLAVCFLQLASSRNTSNKLAMVNRAVYCFNQYKQRHQTDPVKVIELLYNLGRFFAQLRVYSQAVDYFTQAIDQASRDPSAPAKLLLSESVYCLMCIHKELGNQQSVSHLRQQHFLL